MILRTERKHDFRQPSPWRRLLAFLCAFVLLISVSGVTAFAKNDNTIYSDPVRVPIRPTEEPQPDGEPEETLIPDETAEPPEETPEPDTTEIEITTDEEAATPADDDQAEDVADTDETTENTEQIPAVDEVTEEEPSERGDVQQTENADGENTFEQTEAEEIEEPEEETEPGIIYPAGTLNAETEGCTVSINYTSEACIPENAALSINEAKGMDLYSALKAASKLIRNEEDEIWGKQVSEEGNCFYQLTITDAEGNEIRPKAWVNLICELNDAPEGVTYFLTGENARILDEQHNSVYVTDYAMEPFGYAVVNKVQIGTVIQEYSASDYVVTASYGPEAGFPSNTEMKVREIQPGTPEYALYSGMTEEALGEDWSEITLERYFDITFISGSEELEPQADVDVQIVFKDVIELTEEHDIQAVHFENKEAVVIESETDSNDEEAKRSEEVIDTISFTSDSFSVFGVVQRTKITQKVLAADGNTYEINVTYGPEAGIPGNAELLVEEIPEGSDLWEAYRKQTAAALGADDVRLPGLYDISIFVDRQKIEPQVPVNVSVRLANAEAGEELHVVHFKEVLPDELVVPVEKQTEIQPLAAKDRISSENITDAVVEGNTVTFDTDGFSVYAFAYTVVVYYRTASGDNYRITLDYGPDSGIPAGAELHVVELLPGDERYAEYLEKALCRIAGTEAEEEIEKLVIPENQYARFFDIEILSGGQKIEPDGKVSVTFELTDAPEDRQDELKVLHFTGDSIDIMDVDISADAGILFETAAFSVYGVVTFASAVPAVTDLDGRSVTISRNGSYITSGIVTGNYANMFNAGDSSSAIEWTFEAAGQPDKYYIYTLDDHGIKQYMNLIPVAPGDSRAYAAISDSPQTFTVTRNGNFYNIATDQIDGKTYYLNDYRRETGFAGWHAASDDNNLTLNFTDLVIENGTEYMTLVKYNGKYYIVNNDGTLTEIEYNPVTKMVSTDDPLLWKYERRNNGDLLYINTEGKTFTGPGGTAYSFYRRFIDAHADSGIFTEDASHQNGENESRFVFEGNHIRSHQGHSKYLGVEVDENGVPVRLVGNKDASDAVDILFASVVDVTVPSHYAKNHAVTHLDVSVHGNALLEYPLPRGTYYDANGNVLYTITKDNPKMISMQEPVPITKDDIKNADIIATDVNGNEIDNAFYITGYTGNQGDSNPDMPTQIRIEGSFIVASDVKTQYSDNWNWQEDDKWGEWTQRWIQNRLQWVNLKEDETHQKIRQERLASEVTYTVTTTKMVEFTLTDGDQVLYDQNRQPIKVEVPITMTGSCTYWSPKNTCPGIFFNGGRNPDQAWACGCIVGNSGIDSSGIDFTLGGSTKQAEYAYPSVDITKYIIDEEGTLLATTETFQNSFTVYQIENNNLASECNSDYSAYTEEAKLDVSVAGGVGKNYYDLNVLGAMIYIEEDKTSIPKTVKVDGIERQYVKTVIETEYVRRGSGDQQNHTTGEMFLKENEHYNSIPELAGAYRYNNENQNNAILNFYVYNVYSSQKTNITVKKEWQGGTPSSNITLTLRRYKKDAPPEPEKGSLYISHTSEGIANTTELPSGMIVSYTCTDEEGYTRELVRGRNPVPAGWYRVYANVTDGDAPTGYIYETTSGFVDVYVSAGGQETASFVSTYSVLAPKAKVNVEIEPWHYHTGTGGGQYNVGDTLTFTCHISKHRNTYITINGNTIWSSYVIDNAHMNEYENVSFNYTIPETFSDGDVLTVVVHDDWWAMDALSVSRAGGDTRKKNVRYLASTGGRSRDVRSSSTSIPDDYSLDSPETNITVTLNSNNNWQQTYELDQTDETGNVYYYEIVEVNVPDGFEVSYYNNPFKADNAEAVDMVAINTSIIPETGNLIISKTITGNAADLSKKFDFTVVANDSDGYPIPNGTYGDMTFTDGVASFAISNGESKAARNLPDGTVITVNEDEDGYDSVTDGSTERIIIAAGETKTISFTNSLNTYGNLKISKIIGGEPFDEQKSFTFTVQLIGHTGTETYSIVKSANGQNTDETIEFIDGIATFELKHNETVTIKELPNGTQYTVEEEDYTPIYLEPVITGKSNGTIIGGENSLVEVAFENKLNTVDILVEKEWPDFEADDYSWSATFQLMADGVQTEYDPVTINKDTPIMERTFTNLPKYKIETDEAVPIEYTLKETGYSVYEGNVLKLSYDGVNYIPDDKNQQYLAAYNVTEGDNGEQIITVSNVVTQLKSIRVIKEWMGIPLSDTVNYPDVSFALYQSDRNGNNAHIYSDNTGFNYSNITLKSSDNWTWDCPVELPEEDIDGNEYRYYVIETPVQAAENGTGEIILTNPLIQDYPIRITGYIYRNVVDTGDWSPIENNWQQPYNARIGNHGEIKILNKAPGYLQMDLKKKFMEYAEDGALWTTTSEKVGVFIELQLYRRAIEDKESNYEPPIVDWQEYGNSMIIGYDENGNAAFKNDNPFVIKEQSQWHWQIIDNNQYQGVPSHGFVRTDSGIVPVRYQYILKEINTYKDVNGTIPYDYTWSAILPAAWEKIMRGNQQEINKVELFPRAHVGQGDDELFNTESTDLTIEKEWDRNTSVKEVYVKVYRILGQDYNPAQVTDYTNLLGQGGTISNGFNSIVDGGILSDTTVLKKIGNEYVIALRPENAAHISQVLAGSVGGQGVYYYWVEEIAYLDATDTVRYDVNQFEPIYTVNGTTINLRNENNNRTGSPVLRLGPIGSNTYIISNTSTDPEPGSIVIQKTVTGYEPMDGETYPITIKMGDFYVKAETIENNEHQYQYKELIDTEYVYQIEAGESGRIYITDLPVGIYTVQEGAVDDNGYLLKTRYQVGDSQPTSVEASAEIEENTETAVFVNNDYSTASIRVKKISTDGTFLDGSAFKIIKVKDSTGTSYAQNEEGSWESDEKSIDTNTGVVFDELKTGFYKIIETTSPLGYLPLTEKIVFEVSTVDEEMIVTDRSTTMDKHTLTEESGEYVFTIQNKAGLPLPTTGGSGTLTYTIGGLMMILLASVLFVHKKRKKYQ